MFLEVVEMALRNAGEEALNRDEVVSLVPRRSGPRFEAGRVMEAVGTKVVGNI